MLRHTHFKFCPKCGKSALSAHQKNALRCAACGYVYFHNTAAAVAGIIESGERIILVKRGRSPKRGYFDLPGGFVDYNEPAEDALRREVMEELHCGIGPCRYFGSFPNKYIYKSVAYFSCDLFFICTLPPGAAMAPDSEEIAGIRAVGPRSIDFRQIAFPSIRAALMKYAGEKGPTA